VKGYLQNFPDSVCQGIDGEVINRMGNDNRVSWSGLRTIDSLIIACGLAHDVDRIVSNDRHFKKAIPSRLLLSFDNI
jgi:hypothetical protein